MTQNPARPPDAGRKSGGSSSSTASGTKAGLNPGDEAPPGTPGTGENLCRECSGSGRLHGGPCPACNGTGRIVEGIGGA